MCKLYNSIYICKRFIFPFMTLFELIIRPQDSVKRSQLRMKKWVTTFSTHTNNRLPTPSKTQYDRLCLTHTSFCHTKLYSYVFSQLFLLVDIVTKSQWNFNIRIASVICKSSKSIQFKSFFFYKFRSNLQMQIHRPFLYLEIVH